MEYEGGARDVVSDLAHGQHDPRNRNVGEVPREDGRELLRAHELRDHRAHVCVREPELRLIRAKAGFLLVREEAIPYLTGAFFTRSVTDVMRLNVSAP